MNPSSKGVELAADRLAAPLAFALLLVLSLIVFAERGYQLCVQMGLQDCRR